MSFQGKVRAKCPRQCDEWDADVWTFIDGGKDEGLREALLAGDLNFVSCPECGGLFYPEATVIYYDAGRGLLAFVLPETYRAEESRWRGKMAEDYEQMRKLLGDAAGPARLEPKIYFGMETLRSELEAEDLIEDEVEIAKLLAKELKAKLYEVDRTFARERSLPWLLPHRGAVSVASLRQGLEDLLEKNDRLESYRRWLKSLSADPSLPPRR